MKLFFFLIAFFFIFSSFSFAKSCSIYQEYWHTSGISNCRLASGLEVLHSVSDALDGVCKRRVYACNPNGTNIPSGLSNLPDFVQYNPNEKGYPYSCGSSSDAWTQNLVFKGLSDEGFYSCNSGSPVLLNNVDDVNPTNPDNPLTCKEGYSSNFISGMTVKTNVATGKKTTKSYTDYSCLKTSDTDSPFGEGENIGSDIDFSSEYANHNFLQAPQTFTNPDGSKTMVLPNGTKQTIYNNGTLITEYPDGEIRVDNISDLEKTPSNTSGQYIKYQGTGSNGDKYYEMNNGIKYLLEPNGTLTKVLNDLVIQETVNPNTWTPSQDFGFTGHLGTSAVGNGSNGSGSSGNGLGNGQYLDGSNVGDSSNENNEGKPNEEEPIDEKEASKSCTDSSLTYQEKMLCEMNAGVKKLNQESNPSNSANNLLSDYNYNMNRNDKAIKYNLDNVAVSSGVSIVEQEKQNPIISNLNDSLSSSNSVLSNIDASLKRVMDKIKGNSSGGGISIGGGSSGEGSTPGTDLNLDDYLLSDGLNHNQDLNNSNNNTDSTISSIINIYGTFKDNLFNSFNDINSQIEGLRNTIIEPDNIFEKSNLSSCPISYSFDLTSFNKGNKNITFDICTYFSQLHSLGYVIVYSLAMFSLIFSTFIIIGFLV
jgi:hypothetical protein